uniref:Putative secreted protein n=1 Tax=Anopheles darlingi TaxID=43151 RepID=A0A2M4DLV0_ANODA
MVSFRVALLLSTVAIVHGFWTSCEPHAPIFRNVQSQLSNAARDYGTRYSDGFESAAPSLRRVLDAAGAKLTESGTTWHRMDEYVKGKLQQYDYHPAQQNVDSVTVLEDLLSTIEAVGQNDHDAKMALDQYNTLVQEVASLQASLYKIGNQTDQLENDKLQLNHTILVLEQKNRDLTAKLEKRTGNISP